jgi:hypothetical protein
MTATLFFPKRNDLRQKLSTAGFRGDNRRSRRFWQANAATNARNP